MATRSRISIQNENGSIESIYCHWDGYPSYNGSLLLNHYANEKKIRELISLGYISSLYENVNPTDDMTHSFDNPQKDVVIAYHRDRGEEHTTDKFKDEQNLIENKDELWEEYNYLWKNGAWYIAPYKETKFEKLTPEMCKD